MAIDGRIRHVLSNFLGTYTSRHSDFAGYWLFGFLVAQLDELRVDLLASQTAGPDSALSAAIRLAAEEFQDQLRKARVAPLRVRSGWLTLRRSANAVEGVVNGHVCIGYRVHFTAEALTELGRRYEHHQVLFVAPHDPNVEIRSVRAA